MRPLLATPAPDVAVPNGTALHRGEYTSHGPSGNPMSQFPTEPPFIEAL
jgi:hypothetical protein